MSVERSIEELISSIKNELNEKIFIIIADIRYSESMYNYKKRLAVVFKPRYLAYEEPDTRSVEILNISCGIFQEYPVKCLEIIKSSIKSSLEDTVVEIIDIF